MEGKTINTKWKRGLWTQREPTYHKQWELYYKPHFERLIFDCRRGSNSRLLSDDNVKLTLSQR